VKTGWGKLQKAIKTGKTMKRDIKYTDEKMNIAVRHPVYRAVKRFLDIVLSSLLIVILFPFFIVFSVIIFLTDFHKPLYVQTRIGKGGRKFNLIKFRTMKYDAHDLEKYLTEDQLKLYNLEYKIEDDPRVTGIGRFLRRFSIDELPQFLNVFIGHMSLIGPRPLVEDETYLFGEDRDALLSVRPGITGLWQVSGRNALTYESGDRQRCEMNYIRNFGFPMDLRIFFKTFKEIFSGSGK